VQPKSPITAAGPSRIFTGFPFYPRQWNLKNVTSYFETMYKKSSTGLSTPNFMNGNFTVLPADRVNDISLAGSLCHAMTF
jgi:hypothetical protein